MKRIFKFSILEIGLVTAFVAVCFAWWVDHKNILAASQKQQDDLMKKNDDLSSELAIKKLRAVQMKKNFRSLTQVRIEWESTKNDVFRDPQVLDSFLSCQRRLIQAEHVCLVSTKDIPALRPRLRSSIFILDKIVDYIRTTQGFSTAQLFLVSEQRARFKKQLVQIPKGSFETMIYVSRESLQSDENQIKVQDPHKWVNEASVPPWDWRSEK